MSNVKGGVKTKDTSKRDVATSSSSRLLGEKMDRSSTSHTTVVRKRRSLPKTNYIENRPIPIIDMLNSAGASLSLIAYTSAKGFIFNLDVTEGNSAYLGYSRSANTFTEEVRSICLKLVVIYNDPTDPNDPELGADIPLAKFRNFGYDPNPDIGNGFDEMIDKTTESKKTFFDEAKNQQQAWRTSIVNNPIQVCPAICNLSLLDNGGSRIFLNLMKKVIITSISSDKNKERSNQTIQYLLNQITNPSYSIGLLAMHTVKNSTSFEDFIMTHEIDTDEGADMYIKLVAQTIRLFLQEKMIHCDLHAGNALVTMDPPTCNIIDFGRVISFKDLSTHDEYSSIRKKDEINDNYETYLDVFNKLNAGITTYRDGTPLITKPNFIKRVLNYILSIDQYVMAKYFTKTGSSIRAPQMSYWVNKYLDESLIDTTILERTFEVLQTYMTQNVSITPDKTTIDRWETWGDIISFKNKPPSDFIVTISSEDNNKLRICGIDMCIFSTVFSRVSTATTAATSAATSAATTAATSIFSFMRGRGLKSRKHIIKTNKPKKSNKTKKQRPSIKRIPK